MLDVHLSELNLARFFLSSARSSFSYSYIFFSGMLSPQNIQENILACYLKRKGLYSVYSAVGKKQCTVFY